MDAILYDKIGKEAQRLSEYLLGTYPQETLTDQAVASFDDGADDIPIKQMVVAVDPVQAGSGDPSPENIRPISGWTGAKVTHTGKNIFNADVLLTLNTWAKNNGVYSGMNTRPMIEFADGIVPNIKFIPNTQYTFSCYFKSEEQKNTSFGFVYDDGTKASTSFNNTTDTKISVTSTSGKNVVGFYISYGSSTRIYLHDIMLEKGNTATAYEPYAGQVYEISFPAGAGTIYGGTLTINQDGSGTLFVDKGFLSLNTADMDNGENYPGWSHSGIRALIGSGKSAIYINQIMNVGTIFSVNTQYTSNDILYLPKEYGVYGYGLTETEWKAMNLTVQICVNLAEPVTYIFTSEQIKTLLGLNNVWADTGNIKKLTYRADLGLFMAKLTMPQEDDFTANVNIPSGKYFMVGNSLYKATTTIPQGDTINPGTNCTAYSLAEALNSLNQ